MSSWNITVKENSQMRWHPLLIRFALSLKYASCSCIRTNKLPSFGFLALPLEGTLRDYTHWCPTISGVQLHFIEQIKRLWGSMCWCRKKQFCLLINKKKIKSGLAFSKSSGKLVGFCDLGSVNSELSEMAMFLSSKKSKSTPELASHMLVFMFKPSLAYTVALYPSCCITSEKLLSVVWEVIETLPINFLKCWIN